MSSIPADLRYATSHEWARLEADGSVTVGISDHAQQALGDVVFIELPEIGKVLDAGQEAGVVESVKAASDIYAPVGGEVIAINEALADSPESVNNDPYGSWFFQAAAQRCLAAAEAAGQRRLPGEHRRLSRDARKSRPCGRLFHYCWAVRIAVASSMSLACRSGLSVRILCSAASR